MHRARSQHAAFAGDWGRQLPPDPPHLFFPQHVGCDTEMEVGSCFLLGAGRDLKLSSGIK